VALACLPWLLHHLHGSTAWQTVFLAGVLIWLVAYVNAFNFMDGVNGISAAQAAVAGLAWMMIGLSQHVSSLAAAGAIAAGSAIGFVPFNFPRARVFLGDVGSYLLGGWIAATVVIGLRAGLPPEAVIAPLGLYLADTANTVVRRVRRGEAWWEPHREHAYQRLVQQGRSHTTVTAAAGSVMALTSLLGMVSLSAPPMLRALADLDIAAVLVAYLASPLLLPAPAGATA
jgi:UDP-N-acetylmuramyl pentapeptide phosphotransferase/UDP-N-acetylglucosamine-1-phosphate transferase